MKRVIRYVLLMIAAVSAVPAGAAEVMYARLTDNSQTLTLYYNDGYQEGSDLLIVPFANAGLRGWNSHAADITRVVIDASFAAARPTSTAYWFSECSSLATVEGLRNLNTSETTDMRFMFSETALTQVSIGHFRTDKVTTMNGMFQSCNALQLVEMTNLTPGPALVNISKMFASCIKLTTIVCNADFSGVEQGTDVFYRCTSLKGGNGTQYNASMTSQIYARPDAPSKWGYFTTSNMVDMDACNVTLSTASYTYDGTAKTPEVTVRRKDDGTVVSADCYRVSYENNVNAGTARVIVSGADDSSVTTNYGIAKARLQVSVTDAEKTYGEDVTLSSVISYAGFVNNEDVTALTTQGQVFFEEDITQWTKAGTYKIYARYVRATNYEADYTDGTLTIHPKSIEGATVTIADYDHTGYAITPETTVELSGYGTLKYYRDYDVTAENNIGPGTATATITGKGNYTGSVQQSFTILDPNPLENVTGCEVLFVEHEPYVYDGTPKTPTVRVRRPSTGAYLPTDAYRVVYEDNVNASAAAHVVVWGRDESHVTGSFSIAKARLQVSVTDAEKTYGEDVTLSPVISYAGFVNNEDVTALTTQGQVFFEEDITQWTKAGTYKIYARYVRATNYEADYAHTGYAITPEATVELSGYGTLKYYRDYDVTAENNIGPGTATATITGKGNYTGSVQQSFTILDPSPLENITGCELLIEEHEPYVYDGTPKTPSVRVRRPSTGADLPTDAYRVVYEDNVNASGSPRVVVWGRDESHLTASFSIAKKTLIVSVTDESKTYGEDVELYPVIVYEGFVKGEDVTALTTRGEIFYEEELTRWTNAGTYKIYARFVRANNYEAEYVDGTLTIDPMDISIAEVEIPDQQYTGNPIVPNATVTLEDYGTLRYYHDYDITAENNIDPGTATATITGKGNYTGSVKKDFRIRMYVNGISGVEYDGEAEGRYYDMQGRYVGTTLKDAKPGVYIVNGKKVVKR